MNKHPLTPDAMIDLLRAECETEGGQRPWAAKHGVSPQFVSDLLRGRRNISERVAEALGYRAEIVFYPIKD